MEGRPIHFSLGWTRIEGMLVEDIRPGVVMRRIDLDGGHSYGWVVQTREELPRVVRPADIRVVSSWNGAT